LHLKIAYDGETVFIRSMNDVIERHTDLYLSEQTYYLSRGVDIKDTGKCRYRNEADIQERVKNRIGKYRDRGFKIDIKDRTVKSMLLVHFCLN